MAHRTSASVFGLGASQLRERDFARLFAARFVSAFGSAMAPVAMAFGVLHLTGSPRAVGLVIAAQTASQVAIQLLAGTLADRWSRQRVMVAADLVAAATQTAMALLLLRGGSRVGHLAALMALNGVAFALHWPASVGLVPQVVERSRLQPANALLALARSGAVGLGGASAGLIVASAGAGWALMVDAATFVVSAWLVSGLRPRAQARSAPSSLPRQLRDGWREFTSHRWLWAMVVQFSLVMAAWSGGFLVIGPVVAEHTLGGAAGWGSVTGAFGLGLLAGGLLGIRLAVRRPTLIATLAVFPFALPLALLAQEAPRALVAAGAFVAGLGWEIFMVLWFTTLQTHVAPEALSRVSAYDILGSIALAPIGQALAGPLVESMGSRRTLWLAVALVVLPTLAVLCVREVRTLRTSVVVDVEPRGPGDVSSS